MIMAIDEKPTIYIILNSENLKPFLSRQETGQDADSTMSIQHGVMMENKMYHSKYVV